MEGHGGCLEVSTSTVPPYLEGLRFPELEVPRSLQNLPPGWVPLIDLLVPALTGRTALRLLRLGLGEALMCC